MLTQELVAEAALVTRAGYASINGNDALPERTGDEGVLVAQVEGLVPTHGGGAVAVAAIDAAYSVIM